MLSNTATTNMHLVLIYAVSLGGEAMSLFQSPSKDNNMYSLAKKSVSIEGTFAPLSDDVRQLRMKVD